MYTKKSNRLVLGEGETIGHKHVLQSDAGVQFGRTTECICMMVEDVGILTHDEHDRMVFKKAKLRSYNQMEFNPMDGTISRVFD